MRLAGIVILYNPEMDVLTNIVSYLKYLDILYVFDNSEKPDESIVKIIKEMPRIEYISYGDNKGISFALNMGLALAKEYELLLTMDQDTRFYDGMMAVYKEMMLQYYQKDDRIAMFAVEWEDKLYPVNEVKLVENAITSGSVVNIEIAKELGGFDEKLFVDEVDNEFCHRARKHDYKVLRFMGVRINHHLGNPIEASIFGKKFKVWNHCAERKYYITRNGIYVMKKYPDLRYDYIKYLIKIFIKTCLAEPDKKRKIFYMLKGVKDAFSGKMGKLHEG